MPDSADKTRRRVRRVVQGELARIDSPQAAEAVIRKAEELAAGQTEQQRADQTAEVPGSAARAVEQKATGGKPPTDEVASVLVTTAAEAVAPTAEAGAVLEGAREVVDPGAPRTPPAAQRGSELLKQAVLQRLPAHEALDARLFLAINRAPHPPWLDSLANVLTVITAGGWIWLAPVVAAFVLRVPRSDRALLELVPSVVGATWIVEYPIKSHFRRRRPFIDVVRALVVGKKPGSWSFPSGHTASSFACAEALSDVWPRGKLVFTALACLVGFSRIYVGAHYPGDVLSGAGCGVFLANSIRRLTRRVICAR